MQEKAILAGGCFWGVEELMRQQNGVVSTRVGYTGGRRENPSYEQISSGATGHAEAMELLFDPNVISYRDILALFFQIHDPTTINRQGDDRGSQYRSAIFYTSNEQKTIAENIIRDIESTDLWPGKIVTEIVPEQQFWEAEKYHQNYLQNKPDGYNCHFPRPDWIIPQNTKHADEQ